MAQIVIGMSDQFRSAPSMVLSGLITDSAALALILYNMVIKYSPSGAPHVVDIIISIKYMSPGRKLIDAQKIYDPSYYDSCIPLDYIMGGDSHSELRTTGSNTYE